jgi:hypothetical protein
MGSNVFSLLFTEGIKLPYFGNIAIWIFHILLFNFCFIPYQESSVATAKDTSTSAQHPATSPHQRTHDSAEQGHQNDPMTSSPTERWVTSRGQLLKRER